MPFNSAQPSYQRFRKLYAENRSDIVFWVGAGLSEPAGLPSWKNLKQLLLDEAVETLVTLEKEEADKLEDQLSRITDQTSLWDAFELVKTVIGPTRFSQSIRGVIQAADQLDPPQTYIDIWKLCNVNGIITLNIDNFAARAYQHARQGDNLFRFNGLEAANCFHYIKGGNHFVGNLHGVHPLERSWVMTRRDIDKIISNPGYTTFINSLFARFTVVFLGISADDVAVGGFLEQLRKNGADLGPQFWITSRADAKTEQWGSSTGVEVIRYLPLQGPNAPDHHSVIKEIFDDLTQYVSRDSRAPAVTGVIGTRPALPKPSALMAMEADERRLALAEFARHLIDSAGGQTDTPQYSAFLKDYSQAIHLAWHLTQWEPHNTFHGFIVQERIASSAFSSVWKLRDDTGSFYALKMIRIENLESGAQLESFRRGVQSLRILTESKLHGVAGLCNAYEIPTSIVMEFIDGENLQSVVESGKCFFWDDGIKIAINVCRLVSESHAKGVLHRDIRPSNVMVPYFHWSEIAAEALGMTRWDVTLINYDMSWHAAAQGKSMQGNPLEQGYYAPEQLINFDGLPARSALVDSYGIGMTLYYSYASQPPPIAGSKTVDWARQLHSSMNRHVAPKKWISAARRLFRLIEATTNPLRDERPRVMHVLAELELLDDAVQGRHHTLPPDFWAEELFARAIGGEYESPRPGIYRRELRPGRDIEIGGDFSERAIRVRFINHAMDGTNWTGIDKLWSGRLRAAKEMLASGGWQVLDTTHYSHQMVFLMAEVKLTQVQERFAKITSSLERGINHVRLD